MADKTAELSGMEGEGVAVKKIKALDAAIDEWRGNVDKRMALSKKEVQSRTKVIELMHKHGVNRYPWRNGDDDEKMLKLDATEKLKLEAVEAAGDPGEGEGD